jgi:hypothetical protein
MTHPDFITEEMLATLDRLPESSATDMIQAIAALLECFPFLNAFQAQQVLQYWQQQQVALAAI